MDKLQLRKKQTLFSEEIKTLEGVDMKMAVNVQGGDEKLDFKMAQNQKRLQVADSKLEVNVVDKSLELIEMLKSDRAAFQKILDKQGPILLKEKN